jgi:hypothetical protein
METTSVTRGVTSEAAATSSCWNDDAPAEVGPALLLGTIGTASATMFGAIGWSTGIATSESLEAAWFVVMIAAIALALNPRRARRQRVEPGRIFPQSTVAPMARIRRVHPI